MTTLIAAASIVSSTIPRPGERLVVGTAMEIKAESRLLLVSAETTVDSDGSENFYGEPKVFAISIPRHGSIRRGSEDGGWLGLEDISEGDEVSAFVHNDQLSVDAPFRAASVVVELNNPVAPPLPSKFSIASDRVSKHPYTLPMTFPVEGKNRYSDTFLAPRGGGKRRHHGQDVMAAKMTPLVAAFDGTVHFKWTGKRYAHNMLLLKGDSGWHARYMHMNNDTPGTDNGRGSRLQAYAPGLKDGSRVNAGDLVGYVGDSGNAESTGPHLHFELWHTSSNSVFNAFPSLKAAQDGVSPVRVTKRNPLPDMNAASMGARTDGVVSQSSDDQVTITRNGGFQMVLMDGDAVFKRVSRSEMRRVGANEVREGEHAAVFAKLGEPLEVVLFSR